MAASTPALDVSSTFGTPSFFTTGAYRRVLPPGSTALVLRDVGNEGMLWQARTDMSFRLTGGFLGVGISRYRGQRPPVSELARGRLTPRKVRRFRAFLRAAGVGAILIDARGPGPWPRILAM